MYFFKFLYDVFVWISNNYSDMPSSFKKRFSEESCVNGRLYLSEFIHNDSSINEVFASYE